MKLQKRFMAYLYIEFLLCFIIIIAIKLNFFSSLYMLENMLGIIIIINYINYYFFAAKMQLEILSLSSYFITFMYLFNLGIPVCRLMNWIDSSGETFMNLRIYIMGITNYIGYLLYAFLLITFLQIGVLYYHSQKQEKRIPLYKNKIEYNYALIKCKNIGFFCILIGILPYILNEYIYIKDALRWGYQSVNSTNLSGTGIGLIGNLFLVGYIMILYAFQHNKKKFDCLFLILLFYQLFRMYITGDRSTGITLILVIIMIRNKFINKIKRSRIIKYGISGIFILFLLKIIETSRQLETFTLKNIIYFFSSNNIIGNTIFGFSNNVWSGMMVRYCMSQVPDYRLGLTYLAAIIGKPLSILNITDSVWQYAAFSNYINSPERDILISEIRSAMGGSFSGEIYFNFGWFGIIIIFFWGYLLAKISEVSLDGIYSNPTISAFLLYLSTLLIWWVRQYFTSVSWYSIFYGIVIFMLYHILSIKKRL